MCNKSNMRFMRDFWVYEIQCCWIIRLPPVIHWIPLRPFSREISCLPRQRIFGTDFWKFLLTRPILFYQKNTLKSMFLPLILLVNFSYKSLEYCKFSIDTSLFVMINMLFYISIKRIIRLLLYYIRRMQYIIVFRWLE